jgi:hypothetical protein
MLLPHSHRVPHGMRANEGQGLFQACSCEDGAALTVMSGHASLERASRAGTRITARAALLAGRASEVYIKVGLQERRVRQTPFRWPGLPRLNQGQASFLGNCLTVVSRRVGSLVSLSQVQEMLGTLVVAALSFSMQTTDSRFGRRELIGSLASGALTVATLTPAPVYAQKSKMIPKSSKEMTERYKEYRLSGAVIAVGSESEEFKAAEARRSSGGASKGPESVDDQMKRLGLRTYSDAVAAGDGYDECASWRGCNRK